MIIQQSLYYSNDGLLKFVISKWLVAKLSGLKTKVAQIFP